MTGHKFSDDELTFPIIAYGNLSSLSNKKLGNDEKSYAMTGHELRDEGHEFADDVSLHKSWSVIACVAYVG
jgi:hypothetical protein